MNVSLRKSTEEDLLVFFENQTDERANYMAAFTPKNPHDKAAYISKWTRLMNDDSVNIQTIVVDEKVIGCVVKFVIEGDAEITYAVSNEYWGKGITSTAVEQFLAIEKTRPIFGRTAFDNFGSQRVLEKTGFKRIGKDVGFANARGKEIEEFIYRL